MAAEEVVAEASGRREGTGDKIALSHMSNEVQVRSSGEAHLLSPTQATITPRDNQSPEDNISCPESRSADTGAPPTVPATVLERHINFALRSYPESRIAQNIAELLHSRALSADGARPATTPPLHEQFSICSCLRSQRPLQRSPVDVKMKVCTKPNFDENCVGSIHPLFGALSTISALLELFHVAIGQVGTFASLSRLSCIGALLSLLRNRLKELCTCHFPNLTKEDRPAITPDSTCPLSTLQLLP